MIITYNDLLKLSKRLFPTGRAFKLPIGSNFEKLIYALGKSEQRALTQGLSILDEILPDNANFSEADAAQWEQKLNLKVNPTTTLAQRKLLILRKYQHPGIHIYRQSLIFIQQQLQDAGFNCFVYENKPLVDYWNKFKVQFSSTAQMGLPNVYGGQNEDKWYIVANSKYPDEIYNIGSVDNNKGVFIIAGSSLSTPADISAAMLIEFRKLILTLKPCNTVAVLNINLINDWILANNIWDDNGHWFDTETWND
jgi:hypothetical protein